MATQFSPQQAPYETPEEQPMATELPSYRPIEIEPAAEPDRGPRILWIAALASIAWLALAAAAIYLIGSYQPLGTISLAEWAGIAAGIAAPLTAFWVAALVAARIAPGRRRETLARIEAAEARFAESAAEVRRQVDSIDAMLAAVTARVGELGAQLTAEAANFETSTARAAETARDLSASLGQDRVEIDAAAERLAASGERSRGDFALLLERLPEAEAQSLRIGEALRSTAEEARIRIGEVETLLERIDARSSESGQRAREISDFLNTALADIDRTARDTEGQFQERAATLITIVDQALARTAEALDQTRAGVSEQTLAMTAAVESCNRSLGTTGREAVETIGARLQEIGGHADMLSERLGAQDERSQALLRTVERGFSVLDAKLANAAQSGDTILSNLGQRLESVRAQIDGLSEPLGGTRGLAGEISAAVTAVRTAANETVQALGEAIPANAQAGTGAVEELRIAVAALGEDVERLRGDAGALAEPIEQGRQAVAGAIGALEAERGTLETSMVRLREEVETAGRLLAETRDTAEGTALAATGQLIEALGRVREVANQTAGTVRDTLGEVVTEATDALARASGDAVRRSMLGPVEDQIASVEAVGRRSADAAQAAAERLSRSLVSVAETAAAVEARVSEADAHLDEAQRTDLALQSNLLVEALNSAAIDITKGLSTEVTESAWKAYLAGDRSVFTRRAARLLDGGDTKALARHYESEPEFRNAVRRYIHDFEAMMRRVMTDREAGALSVTLLSSDVGKLYVALAQATDRLRGRE